MFGANRAYQRWRGMMDDAIVEARTLLEKNPQDPKGLAILEAVDHSMACSSAFLFGRRDSRVAGNESTIVTKIRQFRAKCGGLWRKCGRNVAGLRLKG